MNTVKTLIAITLGMVAAALIIAGGFGFLATLGLLLLALVLILLVIDGLFLLLFAILNATLGRTGCRLYTQLVFPDYCDGACLVAGQACAASTSRPYGPFGWLGTQAATCACVGTPAGAGGATGGGGTGGAGGGGS
jgi:hypothetical protein